MTLSYPILESQDICNAIHSKFANELETLSFGNYRESKLISDN